MNVQPLLTGSALGRRISGTVMSIHNHVINLKEDETDLLVSLIERERDLTARSILLRADEFLAVKQLWKPGATVKLELGDAAAWTGSLTGTPADEGERARLCALCEVLAEALLTNGRPGGLGSLGPAAARRAAAGRATRAGTAGRHELSSGESPFARSTLRVITDAEERWRGGTDPQLDLSRLVGLGIGFTPSGDDFIAGALAACAVMGAEEMVSRNAIEERLRTTTPGGATLLSLALAGSFPAYVVLLVQALRGVLRSDDESAETAPAEAERLSGAVSEAARHGETSGTDTVAGLLYGLSLRCESPR